MIRKFAVEFLGTAILVFFAVGVATLMFGFKFTGASVAAGVVATALAFGLTLLALVYLIGPVSGSHVNPAVTIGALLAGRIPLAEAVGYWIAQFAGGIVGALALWGTFSTSPLYSRTTTGLGTDGYGKQSLINIGVGGAFIVAPLVGGVLAAGLHQLLYRGEEERLAAEAQQARAAAS